MLPAAKPATEDDFAAEYLGPIISCKVVDSLDEAIEHINRYSSQHTEAIVTRDLDAARQFAARIDSSAVMINASTRFNDGGEFGLGAEIGISTDKFHARGPCGINELTSYKYVVYGDGQVRGIGIRGFDGRSEPCAKDNGYDVPHDNCPDPQQLPLAADLHEGLARDFGAALSTLLRSPST